MSDQSYRFNWQNPQLRKTIYPFREKKLRDFLLTYYEIDTWKNLKESDPEKDDSYQQMRADMIDWTYQRLNRIADYFRSGEMLDPTRMEKLEQEKAFLLEHEDSFPREIRIRKRLEGLDGRGAQVFREVKFAQYPQAVKRECLHTIINEKDREHKEWNQELQMRLKYMDLVEAQTNLHSWWQYRLEEASQVVTEIGADLEKLKNLAALLEGEKQLIDHDDLLSQRVDALKISGAIAAHVFKSGRYKRTEQCEYILALIDEKTQERTEWTKNPAKLKEIDDQLANLRQLNHLLDQGRSILMSSQLRAGLGELDEIGQYLFKPERYTRYPQAYQNQYLAAVIDHNNRELQAWQKSLEYSQAKLKYEAEKGSALAAWWQRMVSKFERNTSVIRSDLESLNKLKALLDEEQQSLDRERWIGRAIETWGSMSPGIQTPGRYPRDFVHRYLSVIMDARDGREGAPTAARSIPGDSDFNAQKITRVKHLLEEERQIWDQEELVSVRDQIRKLAGALEPTHSIMFKSPRYTHSDQHGYLQRLVEEKTRAGVVGAGLDKLDQVKALLDQEKEFLERKTRSLEQSRLIAKKQQIVEAIGQQEAYIKNVFYSNTPETEKYGFLSRQIDAKLKERDTLVNDLNSRWRKNRDSWKQIEGEQGQNYRYWKRETDKRENELATIIAALTRLTDLKESLDEEKILSGQGQTMSLSEQINRAIKTLGGIEPVEAHVFASNRFSFSEKMDYLQDLIAERSRERAEWAKELQAGRRNMQLAGQGGSLLAWWQEKAGQAERIVETIDTELNKLEALKKSYLPRKAAVDFREIRQEKSSLARLALLRKRNEMDEDILSTQQVQDENARHDQLLKMILEMFDAQPGRFPKWLQYMVIHFSGIRYKSAHGSWFDPGELLEILRDEQPQLFSQNDGVPPRGKYISATAGEVEATIAIPADVEALETLRGYKKHIPPWAWKEITRFTALRLDTTDPGWEQAEPERRQFDTPDKRLWNGILNQWAREERITLWRERHESTLDVVMTSCVCNEIAENTLHTRGIKAAGGLTRKVDWYFKQARGTANRPDDALKAFFVRPATSEDFRPAASIFWLDWKPQCLYDDQAAQASQVYQHNLLPDGVTLGGKGVDAEGWRYAWESNRVIRRKLKYADPKNPNKFNKAQIDSVAEAERKSIEAKIKRENASLKGNQLERAIQKALQKRKNAMKLEQVKQYLRWTHEAIVLGVEETLDGWQVLTFETAPDRTGLNRRNVGWLVNIDNNSTGQQVFVGYLAPFNDLPDDIVPNRSLPGAYLPGETWASLQARLNEMLRRDLILPRGGYAAKTYPKEAPPQKKATGRESGPGQASREALKALPGLWVEVAPRLDKKAPGKGWLNKPALECYAIGRKSMTKTKVALNRGWPVRVASTRKEKSRNVWHYLVTHSPDEPEAEGLYIRDEDFIPIAPQRAGILVRTKRETKALSFKKTDDPGKPIPDSAGAKLPAGAQFSVSAVHRISDKDPDKYQPGTIVITGGKPHYLVTDCPTNRDAEGLLVRALDVEELRVIPLNMDDILKRRREAHKEAQNGKAPGEPQWSVSTPGDEGEARLFAKSGKARKPGLVRQTLSLKAGTAVQVTAPETVNEKDVCRILACPEQHIATGKYVLAKDLTRVVEKILSKDVLLAAVKSALKDQAGAGSDLDVRLETKTAAQPRHSLFASITASGVSHALELAVRDGRLVIANGDPASPGEQTNHWSAILAASLEAMARPRPDSKLLTVLVGVDPGSGQQQLALYWQSDT